MLQHLLFLFLLIGVPAWDLIETRRLKASRDPKAKLQSYQLTIAILWATALLCFVARGHALFAAPLSPAQVKWLPSGEAAKAASLGFLISISVGLALPAVLAAFSPKVRDRLLAQFDKMDFFLPRTTEELRWFVLVCITAGVCEEVLYRGFLIAYLAVWPLKASGCERNCGDRGPRGGHGDLFFVDRESDCADGVSHVDRLAGMVHFTFAPEGCDRNGLSVGAMRISGKAGKFAMLRDKSKRDSTARADCFAGAKQKKCVGPLRSE